MLIGFNDEENEGSFLWSDDTPVAYTNIEDIGDNNVVDNFGNINPWSGTWALVNKWVSKPFILEKPCPFTISSLTVIDNANIAAQGDLRQALSEKKKEVIEHNFQIFPNPVSDKLSLYFDSKSNEQTAMLRIIQSDGTRLVNERRMLNGTSNNWELSVDELERGIYFVQIIMNEIVLEGRFIKM